MGTPDVIRFNRVKQGLTQNQLARAIDVDPRQITRYENGEREPSLAVARRIADRLHISMDELAGGLTTLNGTWHSAWHNLTGDGSQHSGAVELAQQGQHVKIQPLRGRSTTPDDGELSWTAEIIVDDRDLLGGFKITTETLRRRGLLELKHLDDTIEGRWVRLTLTGTTSGKLVLAPTPQVAAERLYQLHLGE